MSVRPPLAPLLSQRRIFLFWLPLAASWILMGMEMPFVNATLARLSEAERMIAAFGIVGSLSITIESPVIMLLATSTALARSRQSYEMLRRFTGQLMIGTTLIHVLVGWTPVFDLVVRDWMGVPASLLDPVRLGMRLMVIWSAAIAWRRFKQGVLIRYGQTRYVGVGTAVRLAASVFTAAGLALAGRVAGLYIPGIAVGTLALTAGVLIEAAYAQYAARPLIAQKFWMAPDPQVPPLGYGELVRFHTPLAASTLLFLLTQPLISAALARLPDPELVLAAWPVASGLLFISRTPALALPEVIIALMDKPGRGPALRRFSQTIGLASAAGLALLSFTPLAGVYFRTLIGVNATLSARATTGVQVGLLLPLLVAWQSWFRGVLTAHRFTLPITLAMAVNLISMAAVLALGVAAALPGVRLAVFALTLSVSAETLVLWLAMRRLPAPQTVQLEPGRLESG